MKPIYTLDRAKMPHLDAQEYRVKEVLYDIFAVPERNAVGTNSLNNAITILDLSGKKVKQREVRRNFIDGVSEGTKVYLPHFSSDTIGYTQTRGFLLFNVKTGAFKDRIMVRLLQEALQDVAVLDWEKRIFLFNVDFIPGFDGRTADLHVMDLSGDEPKELAKFEIKQEPLMAELGKTSFYFTKEGERLKLHALDDRLRPVEHPLLAIYNTGLFQGEADLPNVHPELPVALFASDAPPPSQGLVVWAATWGGARNEPALFKLSESISGGFRYSPDGKWVLFRDRTVKPMRYVVIPVDPALPHFFGPPILLKTDEEVPTEWNANCAWIADPVSVVCNIRKTETAMLTGEDFEVSKLLKWDLSHANVRK